ncbi:MAG TPA: nucleotide sugar dehydrogenase [Campylobacterales bacterium]|nr:nucleotide sugar dehydrogenase [Campylobacterales bacterium]HIO70433.1 nucleotide sugar dehydrogenase [Campylobacterales bacterium]
MKIGVAGIGYVGLANGIMLSLKHEVVLLDIVPERVEKVNRRELPIVDRDMEEYFRKYRLNLRATLDKRETYQNSDFVIVATPTDYDPESGYFDTSSVEAVIRDILEINPKATIIIKSTIPVGYTEQVRSRFGVSNILFSPEFLREGKALYDNLYPSRIIIGDKGEMGRRAGELLSEGVKKDVPILYTTSTEAEAIKLFANTYLAMRIAFFNELDTYAKIHNLDTKAIIQGVSLDPRIGDFYNNPSFGYGGYCLPKDTKQLMANYKDIPHNLISAIVEANQTRKIFIADDILRHNPKVVGIYRLTMKRDSDNFRESSIQDIIRYLKNRVEIVIYEPLLKEDNYLGCPVIGDIEEFAKTSDLIVANRVDEVVKSFGEKLYSRDMLQRDS